MAETNVIPTNEQADASEAAARSETSTKKRTRTAKSEGTPKRRKGPATGNELSAQTDPSPPSPEAGPTKARKPRATKTDAVAVVTVKKSMTKDPKETKAAIVIKKLRSAKGVSIQTIMEATGWQAHTVRGFFSAVVKKKLGLELASDSGKDGVRRYRIVAAAGEGA